MKTLIIGGTGTLGNEVARQISSTNQVTIFSRDELKQHFMKKQYPGYRYIVGDVRDKDAVFDAVRGHDMVYLFAALKHVSTGENSPEEVYKTNVGGCINTLAACRFFGSTLTFSSTDKAVMPINAYGASKMMAEKILLAENNVNVRIARYGNVLGSRGSVLDYFIKCTQNNEPINITHQDATRFWIKIEDAAKFVINAERALNIPMLKASKVIDLAKAVSFSVLKDPTFKITQLSLGEKLHESLSETLHSNTCEQYTTAELQEIVNELVP